MGWLLFSISLSKLIQSLVTQANNVIHCLGGIENAIAISSCDYVVIQGSAVFLLHVNTLIERLLKTAA